MTLSTIAQHVEALPEGNSAMLIGVDEKKIEGGQKEMVVYMTGSPTAVAAALIVGMRSDETLRAVVLTCVRAFSDPETMQNCDDFITNSQTEEK